jgi:hypothetical protein
VLGEHAGGILRRVQEAQVSGAGQLDDARVRALLAEDRGGLAERRQLVLAEDHEQARAGVREAIRILPAAREPDDAEPRLPEL